MSYNRFTICVRFPLNVLKRSIFMLQFPLYPLDTLTHICVVSLVHIMTEEQKDQSLTSALGINSYFAPAPASKQLFGSGSGSEFLKKNTH